MTFLKQLAIGFSAFFLFLSAMFVMAWAVYGIIENWQPWFVGVWIVLGLGAMALLARAFKYRHNEKD